ncbi:MAG TPA: hypothetical protein VJQ57_11410 [Acidimicrobiia bacterium]|nr:hypothetical protein [Acidimicrobiia bacterium]
MGWHRTKAAAVVDGGRSIVGENESGFLVDKPSTFGEGRASAPKVETGLAIDQELAEVEIDLLAGQTDDSFDEPKLGYERVDKDGDRPSGWDAMEASTPEAIAVDKGWFHRAIGYDESRHGAIEYVRLPGAVQLARS